MPPIHIGSTVVKKVYWGTTQINKVYDGSSLVYTSCQTAALDIMEQGTSGLTSCTATGTCSCDSLDSTGNSCDSYSICASADWSYYTNDGYVCTSTVGLGTCSCSTNFGGTDYLCNASVYSDQCSSVGWSSGQLPSQVNLLVQLQGLF